jgi:glycosyltransferase involved in cell wall biosynthesis
MQNLAEILDPEVSALERAPQSAQAKLPITVLIPVKNEAANLARCLNALQGMGETYVIDSQSRDATAEIAASYGAKVAQFHYAGGWPKKRQWALESLPMSFDWVLLLDADEVLTPDLVAEIGHAITDPRFDGYYLKLEMHFLGGQLRHCGAGFKKLSLFRRGLGRFECRFREQDDSMCDMEVHEHVIVQGRVGSLRHPLIHKNVESLSHYIRKHDQYSNWESRVLAGDRKDSSQIEPNLFGSQAQRRRWLKKSFFRIPGSPLALFVYRYVFRLGFLDRTPGLIYCLFQAIQMFHTKAKIYEQRMART